jgi:putative membrane protein
MLPSALRCTPVLALCAAALVSGCGKDNGAADSARVADSIAAATPAATTPTPAPAPAMTDASILGKLDAANVHDSTGGSMAASKGTSSDVKEFGRMMMREHHAMRKEGMDLAKKATITPETPSGDADLAAMQAAHDSLTSMAKGAAWDKAYIDHEVAGHEKVLAFAQSAAGSAQNADLKSALEKSAPTIQKHLDRAREIQSKLSAAPATGATTDTTKKP